MAFDHLVVVRGGGDIGSGVIWRLRRAGFPVVVLELARPLTVRRSVAFSTAVEDGTIVVDGITGTLAGSVMEAEALAGAGTVPVLVSERMPAFLSTPSVVVDARLAKRNIDTSIDQAPLVIGLGPGFDAGANVHAVVETNRGHDLGRVIWEGTAAPDTGVPGVVGGVSEHRVIRSPGDGVVDWRVVIGQTVEPGETLGTVGGDPVDTTIGGVVRGLISPGPVHSGLKIGDVDPRGEIDATASISDKALAVGGGVLEAVLTWMNPPRR